MPAMDAHRGVWMGSTAAGVRARESVGVSLKVCGNKPVLLLGIRAE